VDLLCAERPLHGNQWCNVMWRSYWRGPILPRRLVLVWVLIDFTTGEVELVVFKKGTLARCWHSLCLVREYERAEALRDWAIGGFKVRRNVTGREPRSSNVYHHSDDAVFAILVVCIRSLSGHSFASSFRSTLCSPTVPDNFFRHDMAAHCGSSFFDGAHCEGGRWVQA